MESDTGFRSWFQRAIQLSPSLRQVGNNDDNDESVDGDVDEDDPHFNQIMDGTRPKTHNVHGLMAAEIAHWSLLLKDNVRFWDCLAMLRSDPGLSCHSAIYLVTQSPDSEYFSEDLRSSYSTYFKDQEELQIEVLRLMVENRKLHAVLWVLSDNPHFRVDSVVAAIFRLSETQFGDKFHFVYQPGCFSGKSPVLGPGPKSIDHSGAGVALNNKRCRSSTPIRTCRPLRHVADRLCHSVTRSNTYRRGKNISSNKSKCPIHKFEPPRKRRSDWMKSAFLTGFDTNKSSNNTLAKQLINRPLVHGNDGDDEDVNDNDDRIDDYDDEDDSSFDDQYDDEEKIDDIENDSSCDNNNVYNRYNNFQTMDNGVGAIRSSAEQNLPNRRRREMTRLKPNLPVGRSKGSCSSSMSFNDNALLWPTAANHYSNNNNTTSNNQSDDDIRNGNNSNINNIIINNINSNNNTDNKGSVNTNHNIKKSNSIITNNNNLNNNNNTFLDYIDTRLHDGRPSVVLQKNQRTQSRPRPQHQDARSGSLGSVDVASKSDLSSTSSDGLNSKHSSIKQQALNRISSFPESRVPTILTNSNLPSRATSALSKSASIKLHGPKSSVQFQELPHSMSKAAPMITYSDTPKHAIGLSTPYALSVFDSPKDFVHRQNQNMQAMVETQHKSDIRFCLGRPSLRASSMGKKSLCQKRSHSQSIENDKKRTSITIDETDRTCATPQLQRSSDDASIGEARKQGSVSKPAPVFKSPSSDGDKNEEAANKSRKASSGPGLANDGGVTFNKADNARVKFKSVSSKGSTQYDNESDWSGDGDWNGRPPLWDAPRDQRQHMKDVLRKMGRRQYTKPLLAMINRAYPLQPWH